MSTCTFRTDGDNTIIKALEVVEEEVKNLANGEKVLELSKTALGRINQIFLLPYNKENLISEFRNELAKRFSLWKYEISSDKKPVLKILVTSQKVLVKKIIFKKI